MNTKPLALFASATLALSAYGCAEEAEEPTTTSTTSTTSPTTTGTGGSTTTTTTTTTTGQGGSTTSGGGMGQGGSTTTTTTGAGAGGMGQGGAMSTGGSSQGGSGQGGSMAAGCGDLLITGNETCDDGNTTAGDGCDASCQLEAPACQNNIVEFGETCDDGNNVNGDGCSDTCQIDGGDCLGAVDLNDTNVVTVMNGVTTYSGDLTGSTLIGFGAPTCGIADASPSVIHAFTAPATGIYTFETAGNGGVSDTVMWAYVDCNGAGGGNEIECNDDGQGLGLYSSLSFVLPSGSTIFLVVGGYDAEVGTYDLTVTPDEIICNNNGMIEGNEFCDDGNLTPGDGCDRNCLPEATVAESEANNDSSTANAGTDATFAGSIDPTNDEDWYEVIMPAGTTTLRAAFFSSHAGNGCDMGSTTMLGPVDSELEIFESDGTTSVATDDQSLYCADLTATGLTAGNTYYVRAAASTQFCPGCIFQYNLGIQTAP